jgi:GTPase SAR1 family protein
MWLREVSKNGGEKLPVFLIGTKMDLKNQRKVKKE